MIDCFELVSRIVCTSAFGFFVSKDAVWYCAAIVTRKDSPNSTVIHSASA